MLRNDDETAEQSEINSQNSANEENMEEVKFNITYK